MKNPHAAALGKLGGKAGKGKPKNRSPEAQARITAAVKRYHEQKREKKR